MAATPGASYFADLNTSSGSVAFSNNGRGLAVGFAGYDATAHYADSVTFAGTTVPLFDTYTAGNYDVRWFYLAPAVQASCTLAWTFAGTPYEMKINAISLISGGRAVAGRHATGAGTSESGSLMTGASSAVLHLHILSGAGDAVSPSTGGTELNDTNIFAEFHNWLGWWAGTGAAVGTGSTWFSTLTYVLNEIEIRPFSGGSQVIFAMFKQWQDLYDRIRRGLPLPEWYLRRDQPAWAAAYKLAFRGCYAI